MRAFLALEVPGSSRRALSGIRTGLNRDGAEDSMLRWTRTENLHLTIRFLGEIDESTGDSIVSRLRGALQKFGPILLRIDSVSWFPVRRPTVLAANVVPTERLLRLFDAVESDVVGSGLPAESRTPHPHITLARIRKRHGQAPRGAVEPVNLEFECRELVMYRSELFPSGAKYSRYGEIALGDAP